MVGHMFVVYILKSRQYRKSYVGYTNDIERRLMEHNAGKSNFTSKYAPWDIIHKEEYLTQTEALAREKYLKSKQGRRFLKQVFQNLQ